MLESLFIKAFRWFPVNISKLLRAAFFYRTPLVAASANVLFCIIFSKRLCWIYCSFTLHNCFILKPKITLICFHSLYHSLLFVEPLVVIRCQSWSLVVNCCLSLSSLSLIVPLVDVTRCHSLSLVAIRFQWLRHSLSLVVTRGTTRLPFYKRSLNNIPLSRTKTLVNNLLWGSFNKRAT